MTIEPQPADFPSPRPAREAAAEIVVMSAVAVMIVAFVFVLPGWPGTPGKYLGLASVAGEAALGHIGWAFGAYIPILLGFYAIVIGGQFVGDASSAAKTRRTLGFVAEGMASALVPALVLIFVACIVDFSKAGALLVILPVSAVMFFLSIQLGGFVVFEPAVRLASARQSREWAAERLRALRLRSRRPVWLIVLANVLVGTGIGFLVLLSFRPSHFQLLLMTVMCFMFALALSLSAVGGLFTVHTARGRSSRIVGRMLLLGTYSVVAVLTAEVWVANGAGAGLSLASVVVFSALSGLAPLTLMPRAAVTWSVHGASTRYSARSFALTYKRNVGEIRELMVRHQADRPTVRARLAAAARALREPARQKPAPPRVSDVGLVR
jgi:hypothetical protein